MMKSCRILLVIMQIAEIVSACDVVVDPYGDRDEVVRKEKCISLWEVSGALDRVYFEFAGGFDELYAGRPALAFRYAHKKILPAPLRGGR